MISKTPRRLLGKVTGWVGAVLLVLVVVVLLGAKMSYWDHCPLVDCAPRGQSQGGKIGEQPLCKGQRERSVILKIIKVRDSHSFGC